MANATVSQNSVRSSHRVCVCVCVSNIKMPLTNYNALFVLLDISTHIIINILLDFAQVCRILLQSAIAFPLNQFILTIWQRIIIGILKAAIIKYIL